MNSQKPQLTEIQILHKLRDLLVNFLDELIESFPQEGDFLTFRILIKDQIPMSDIAMYVAMSLCPLSNMVKEKDENFFLKNNVLFDGFSDHEMNRINHFKNMWLSPSMDAGDKEAMWKWFEAIISVGNSYRKLKGM